ncbi:MAG: hypothetical protein KAR35_02670, partial [Candidatus Heimdallarchaeota archaeon]|nr:hypothetical protein [Candidatus Heimdallarchaeota archaeon]MCK5048258.1 hypothetical protein [Candidatus Heimdallarchaeota archaeon]
MSNIKFDFSFVEEALRFLRSDIKKVPSYLIDHPAAKIIHAHYSFFHFTGKLLTRKELLDSVFEKITPSDSNFQRIEDTLSYLKDNLDELSCLAEEEALFFAPKNYELSSTIFIVIGYDIGIVFNGNVVMDVNHAIYLDNPREMLYFAIHELSHVIMYSFQQPFRFSNMKTRRDLIQVLKYHTQLEGLGVVTPYKIREREQAFNHSDYQVLQNPEKMIKLEEKFFSLLKEAEKEPE